MRPQTGSVENRGSQLLSPDENEQIFQLLGHRCQTLATGVVQVFVTDAPEHSTWRRNDAGILCLVKDNQRKSYFFRLYCLTRRQMVWEHEVYNGIEYNALRPYLHSFEGEESIVAFNFASEDDARTVRNVLLEKLEARKQRRIERKSRASTQMSRNSGSGQSSSTMGSSVSLSSNQMYGSSSSGSSQLVNGSLAPSPRQQHRSTGNKKKDKDSKRRLTKADIGLPKDFRHVSHVGWDPNKGFDVDVDDPQLKLFFNKAGVSDSQLQDRETREFIYDFINRHGGIDAVKDEVVRPPAQQVPSAPPPVPARTAPVNANSYHFQARSAPPPPPSRTGALPPPLTSQPSTTSGPPPPPPPPPPPTRMPPQRQDTSSSQGAIPAPPPPPPPLPPPSSEGPPPPAPVPPTPASSASVDVRSALMESIRSGKTLKHVELDRKPSAATDSRGELLDQIRQGVELKAVQPNQKPPPNASLAQDSLAGALARALAERSRAIHSDTSGSSADEDEEEDDEWED